MCIDAFDLCVQNKFSTLANVFTITFRKNINTLIVQCIAPSHDELGIRAIFYEEFYVLRQLSNVLIF